MRSGPLLTRGAVVEMLGRDPKRGRQRATAEVGMKENEREIKPFLEHLEDLRRTLLKSLAAVAVGFCVMLPLAPHILVFLERGLRGVVADPERFLRSLQVSGALVVTMRIAFWAGLMASLPFVLYFVGMFVLPALRQREKVWARRAVLFGGGLFFLGVVLGYVVILPAAVRIMLGWHAWLGIRPEWTVTSYTAFAVQLLIAFGLAFELPVVIIVLGRLGILTSGLLRKRRRYVIVGVLVLAMLLTPPDVFTQLVMAVPMILLYELCIWVVWMDERRRVGGSR